jgi:hypothetical protein
MISRGKLFVLVTARQQAKWDSSSSVLQAAPHASSACMTRCNSKQRFAATGKQRFAATASSASLQQQAALRGCNSKQRVMFPLTRGVPQ